MFCPSCGAQNSDTARFCASCGAELVAAAAPAEPAAPQPAPAPAVPPAPAPQPQQAYQQQAYQQAPAYQQPVPYAQPRQLTDTDRTLRLVAFILSVLTTVACAMFIIPLAWMIPMTVHTWGIYQGNKNNTVAFGVCTLIFLNLVSGILLLVSTKEEG